MHKYKKKVNQELPLTTEESNETNYSIDTVVERLEAGLVGSLKIEDELNYPIFKLGDIVQLRAPIKLQLKDFVLYKAHDEYFLRRIIKYKEDEIFVAGDNEKAYRLITKNDIVGKAISRERKNKRLSFSLTPKKRFYTFRKVKLSYFRLGNRVINYEQEVNNESLEIASISAYENKNAANNRIDIKYDIDLDSDLQSFINPDKLVLELKQAMNSEKETPSDKEDLQALNDEFEHEASDNDFEEAIEDVDSTEETVDHQEL